MTLRGGGDAAPPAATARRLTALLVLVSLLGAADAASASPGARAAVSPAGFAETARPAPLARPSQAPDAPAATPPADPPPAGQPTTGAPVPLSGVGGVSRWSFVIRRVVVRAEPRIEAAPVMRLKTLTPERTQNLVLALERQLVGGRQWVRVRLPTLPNNSTGWVPREALGGYEKVRTRLFVDTRRLRARLERGGRTILRVRVGVGRDRWPTPRGEFYIRNELRGFDSPVYGPVAFGTSARSAVLTDWPGGGFVGIHGTNRPNLLPGRVSHGCIRMRNRDILRLARLMPVGTPLTIT
ncbi:MAG: Protein erfK/srfK precursor [uncultured Solirubrobacteraceae bacterium]|uniref:Protein erfK/srfK n=1 Tax=uncultured Solirubrobacteraceae bacterium TaxID=1162706 RepID=A0A6J4RNI6_9ACTN|nr:MAG: Protein erfK/srfK precursor [uncultured Solirubrobacteraceae bacterium]